VNKFDGVVAACIVGLIGASVAFLSAMMALHILFGK
jgi:hypothetical protein